MCSISSSADRTYDPRSIGFRVQSNILDKFVARELKAAIKQNNMTTDAYCNSLKGL